MTLKESYRIKPGIYLVHWKAGGASLAAVGMSRNGDRWLAPCNWVHPTTDGSTRGSHREAWRHVSHVEPVLSSWERADKRDHSLDGDTTHACGPSTMCQIEGTFDHAIVKALGGLARS